MNQNVNPVVSMLDSKLTKGGKRTRTRTTTQVIPRSLARGRRQKCAKMQNTNKKHEHKLTPRRGRLAQMDLTWNLRKLWMSHETYRAKYCYQNKTSEQRGT